MNRKHNIDYYYEIINKLKKVNQTFNSHQIL